MELAIGGQHFPSHAKIDSIIVRYAFVFSKRVTLEVGGYMSDG